MTHKRRTRCRGCGGEQFTRFLELGPQPLANAFPRDPGEFAGEAMYPLDVYFCHGCSLVQLLDVIDPEVLFREYIYVSGTSELMASHFRQYADDVIRERRLDAGSFVVEVASNDGTLLANFADRGVRVLGVEPAVNIAQIANDRGIPTVVEFFSPEVAGSVREEHGRADAVLGNNVLAHVDDTVGFLRGAADLIQPDGVVVVEVPYLLNMLDGMEWDTVYHEHLCYFSVTALRTLFARAGLQLVRVDPLEVHGGSIRAWGVFAHGGAEAGSVSAFLAQEEARGLTSPDRFLEFGDEVQRNRDDIVAMLTDLKSRGHRLAAYGAPAKGNTLLNYCRIGTDILEYTVDRSALKVGRYTPGMHLPVLPAEELAERRPDYAMILAWNFAEEIIRQQRAYREAGGRFIIPVPAPQIIEEDG